MSLLDSRYVSRRAITFPRSAYLSFPLVIARGILKCYNKLLIGPFAPLFAAAVRQITLSMNVHNPNVETIGEYRASFYKCL